MDDFWDENGDLHEIFILRHHWGFTNKEVEDYLHLTRSQLQYRIKKMFTLIRQKLYA